ncbi:unnamed protein product [Tuber melanosporum]|uniref:(Perigord truffle) hypothetical protein n=1 Tax=Tuber melanosporum (strain Mel28) TaxID=656061 RepID=D5GHI6_TUBMM|nr:uncharacterized protein GSTUM_00007933001 [Tuber melanosporum]CAZ83979.1 unnamed protein product [Tuber melanosporum]
MTTKMMTRWRRARARMSWRTGEGSRRSEMDGLLHCGGGFSRPRVRVRVLRLMGITRKIGKRWFFYHRFFPFLFISHFNRNIPHSLPHAIMIPTIRTSYMNPLV